MTEDIVAPEEDQSLSFQPAEIPPTKKPTYTKKWNLLVETIAYAGHPSVKVNFGSRKPASVLQSLKTAIETTGVNYRVRQRGEDVYLERVDG
jgi:hypothetical protein